RSLEDDLKLTSGSTSYAERPRSMAAVQASACGCNGHAGSKAPLVAGPCECDGKAPGPKAEEPIDSARVNAFPRTESGRPDFARMSVPQRLAYHRERLGLGR